MKELTVMTSVTVTVTDEEYDQIMETACDEGVLGNPYHDVEVPEWLSQRVMAATPNWGGYIPSSSWGYKTIYDRVCDDYIKSEVKKW